MSLRAALAKAVSAAFTAVGDVPVLMSVVHLLANPTRDATTGAYSASSLTTSNVPVIISSDHTFKGNAIASNQKVALIKTANVTTVSIGDTISRTVGHITTTYEVVDTNIDPAEVLWTLLVQLKSEVVTPT